MVAPATRQLPKTAIPLPIDAIAAFCRRWQVREFALFGSVLRDDFRPAESDVDVMVTFDPLARITLANRLDMQEELEALFARSVDLVTREAIERSPNWYRRKAIVDTSEVIYGG